jgi:hypothetical protein
MNPSPPPPAGSPRPGNATATTPRLHDATAPRRRAREDTTLSALTQVSDTNRTDVETRSLPLPPISPR